VPGERFLDSQAGKISFFIGCITSIVIAYVA
jgi:hypothetical protein